VSAKTAKARIDFLLLEEGGRHTLPHSGYRPVARFDGDPHPEFAWSLTLTFDKPVGRKGNTATVSFLAPEGPSELFMVGRKFSLYEGAHLIGCGVIEE
jgi:hypothetical protein